MKQGNQFLVFVTAGIVLFLGSVFYTLPSNVLSLRGGAVRNAFNTISPQDWAFFTRDPQSTMIGAYELTPDGGAVSRLTTPQNRVRNSFGLSRTQRAQGPELGFLDHAVGGWANCDGSVDYCIDANKNAPTQNIANTSPVPTICGDTFITQEEPQPWAFRSLTSHPSRVTKVAHISAECK